MPGLLFNVGELEDWKTKIGEWARQFKNPILGSKEDLDGRQRLRQVMGIVEEYGELMDAYTGSTNDKKEIMDAVADIIIYSLDLCYGCQFKVVEIVNYDTMPTVFEATFLDNINDQACPAADHLMEGMAIVIGRLAHATLKWDQNIRMNENHPEKMQWALCHIWRMLYRFCTYNDVEFNTLVVQTAEKVTRRDWIKSPDTAHLEV
jgi:NTP pyrophosphatase (non-canonical NTP hydrolase)